MSEEQLKAFLEAAKADAGLQKKLKGATELDTAVAIAQEYGFDVSKEDLVKHQAKQTVELSDEELEGVTGGAGYLNTLTKCGGCPMGILEALGNGN